MGGGHLRADHPVEMEVPEDKVAGEPVEVEGNTAMDLAVEQAIQGDTTGAFKRLSLDGLL